VLRVMKRHFESRLATEEEDDMTMTATHADTSLRESVMRELAWDPAFDAAKIGVTTKEGIVALSGYVETYAARLAAERAARRVYGVSAVANELSVKLAEIRIDPDLAADALQALSNRIDVPLGITVTVRDGYITLGGTVDWMYQRAWAERAVKYLRGVRGVFNNIVVKPSVSPKDVQKRIVQALHRHADIDARRIHVETEGRTVILSGLVNSWAEKNEAERAAWAAPGVSAVDDRIGIAP
jgi:osmotically-inducible protein OsmY